MHVTKNRKQQLKEIKQLVDKYNKSQEENDKQEIIKELKLKINDPISISNSDHLNEGNPLKTKARIIADAFESVTNGMYNPEAIEGLNEITEKSIFYDWKILINIIDDIYKKNFIESEININKLSTDSCLYPLKEILNHLIGKTPKPENKNTESLINKLNGSDNEISRNIKELELAKSEKNWESFIELATMLITDLYSIKKQIAIKLTMWSIKTIYNKDYFAETFISNIKFIFGEAETFRIIGLSLIKENIEISLFFWIKSLFSRIENESIIFEESIEYINIINTLLNSYFNNSELNKSYSDSLLEMLEILKKKIQLSAIDNKEKLISLLKNNIQKDSVIKTELIKEKKTSAIQLELF